MPQTRNPRNGRIMSDEVEQARLNAEAVAMRRDRMSYRQIAAVQGCSANAAHHRVKLGLAAIPYEAVTDLRQQELLSLDKIEERCLAIVEDPPILVQQGRVMLDPITGQPMPDEDAVLRATQTILRIKDARAKLTGAYAPVKSSVTVITEDAVDAEIRRLTEELADRDRRPAGEAAATADAPTAAG